MGECFGCYQNRLNIVARWLIWRAGPADGLWIGPAMSARSPAAYVERGITHIVAANGQTGFIPTYLVQVCPAATAILCAIVCVRCRRVCQCEVTLLRMMVVPEGASMCTILCTACTVRAAANSGGGVVCGCGGSPRGGHPHPLSTLHQVHRRRKEGRRRSAGVLHSRWVWPALLCVCVCVPLRACVIVYGQACPASPL